MASKLLSAGVFMLSLAHAMPQSNTPRYELDPREGKIVGGEPAEFGEFPFIVSITTKSLPDLNRCGGTLLDATTVLTAGHCSIFDPEDVVIRAGTLNFKEGGQQAEVESIIVHPEYAEVGPEETPVNDVAIWKLKRPIELDDTVGFATLPSAGSDPRVNSTVTTAGWGTVESQGEGSDELLKVSVPVVDRAACAEIYAPRNHIITENMFCAGVLGEGGKDSCQGDSGGPIVDEDGAVVGVVSFGIGCGRADFPGVYARLGGNLLEFVSSNL